MRYTALSDSEGHIAFPRGVTRYDSGTARSQALIYAGGCVSMILTGVR
jgi:hypothetical protein